MMAKLKRCLTALMILSGTVTVVFFLKKSKIDERVTRMLFQGIEPEFWHYKRLTGLDVSSTFDSYHAYLSGQTVKYVFNNSDVVRKININNDGSDVIVFLRVQKTGSSTLCKHLSHDVDLSPWCNCSKEYDNKDCQCLKDWRSRVLLKTTVHDATCGMHADWLRLSLCIDGAMDKRHHTKRKRRHLFITMVRDPLRRYLSEWMHVRLHGQWGSAPRQCRSKTTKHNWAHVSLAEFMNCSSNPAINRQVKLISDRRLVQTNFSRSITGDERLFVLLKSAMENLKNFAYFGITEHQELSQIVFENTFNIRYARGFETLSQRAGSKRANISGPIRQTILHMNRFDVLFYQYAKDLFRQRVLKLIETTHDLQLKTKLKLLLKSLFE